MNDEIRLEFHNVENLFPSRNRQADPVVAVRDVSFGIARGEVASIISPSGCGKRTLLNLVVNLDRANAEIALVAGKPATKPNPHVACIELTLAVIAIVVGDFVRGNQGLGYLLTFGEGQGRVSMAFISIILLIVISLLVHIAVLGIERYVLHYLPERSISNA
jgi:ABC-type iron transport system FetAB ATPase subunit